jgi:hypothetical protein
LGLTPENLEGYLDVHRLSAEISQASPRTCIVLSAEGITSRSQESTLQYYYNTGTFIQQIQSVQLRLHERLLFEIGRKVVFNPEGGYSYDGYRGLSYPTVVDLQQRESAVQERLDHDNASFSGPLSLNILHPIPLFVIATGPFMLIQTFFGYLSKWSPLPLRIIIAIGLAYLLPRFITPRIAHKLNCSTRRGWTGLRVVLTIILALPFICSAFNCDSAWLFLPLYGVLLVAFFALGAIALVVKNIADNFKKYLIAIGALSSLVIAWRLGIL